MNVKEKIKKYLKIKGLRAIDFEKSIGASNGYINSISKGIGGDKLEKIRELYPDFDTVALFDSSNDSIIIENVSDNDTNKIVKRVAINNNGVPYYDIDYAGGWSSEEVFANQLPNFFITSPDFEKADFACNLIGQSISRRIPHRAVIGLRQINDWEFYFPTNEVYAVLMKNELRTVKIVKRSEKEGYLTLIPDPLPEYNQTIYEPEEVPIHFVAKMFQIVAWAQFERVAM